MLPAARRGPHTNGPSPPSWRSTPLSRKLGDEAQGLDLCGSSLKARLVAADHFGVEEAKSHVCCSMTSVLLRLVRAAGGDEAVTEVLAEAGWGRGAAALETTENWVSFDEAVALLE